MLAAQQQDMLATNLSTSMSSNFQAALQHASQQHQQQQHLHHLHHNNNNSSSNNNNMNAILNMAGPLTPGGMTSGGGPGSNHDNSPLNLGLVPSPSSVGPPESPIESPLASPLGLIEQSHIPSSVEVGIGVSGMTYKPPRSFVSPRPESLFQEDISELVKSSHALKEKDKISVKLEPLADSRCE